MKLADAIATLDSVIPPPHNKMVDTEHMNIAVAWQTIKEILDPMDIGTLCDWFIHSVSANDPPVWTEEHIEELLKDFFVFSKGESEEDTQ